ncbi:MAG: UTP--glucose-1-phosphate uridylyltransferase GalU [Rhizobiales bacterium]|nr:UTP--glucose-1-phosphate uridylyltransferase GalU [Hyphomicrobiales bacterium]
MKRIRKAVFPVAGLGTRFLPATKAMPKEMLTVVDRPVIQHVVDEAREAGIEHFIFVTGRNKHVIEDHFDRSVELEMTLREKAKLAEINMLEELMPGAGQTSFTRQQAPLGLGHAVWCARDLVGDEPFALLLPDMIVKTEGKSCLAQMMDVYHDVGGGNVVGVERVDAKEAHKFGIVGIADGPGPVWPVRNMVEKPKPGTAPSNLYIMGRYILQPEIFGILASQERGAGDEIQLTDAMLKLLASQSFVAFEHDGQTFDCGSKLGFLLANVALALEDGALAGPFSQGIRDILDGSGKAKTARPALVRRAV